MKPAWITPSQAHAPAVTVGLQRVLDAMPTTPALVKTPVWDIVAWNSAAAVLTDYALLPAADRNVLRRLFGTPAVHAAMPGWEADARFALAAFRVDIARAGDYPGAAAPAAELQATSADFRRLWAENEMRSSLVGRKRIERPAVGSLTLDYSTWIIRRSRSIAPQG